MLDELIKTKEAIETSINEEMARFEKISGECLEIPTDLDNALWQQASEMTFSDFEFIRQSIWYKSKLLKFVQDSVGQIQE